MIKFYGLPFVISFLFSIIFTYLLIYIFKQKSWNNRLGKRHIHLNKKISRFGGLAIFISFILTLFVDHNIVIDQKIAIMLFGAFLISLFGLFDDFWELKWFSQFFFQGLIFSLIFFLGIKTEFITNPLGGVIFFNNFFSFIFTFIWISLIVNVLNWSDGVDGLMGGVVFFASISLFFLSLRSNVNQPPLAIISISLAGSVLGFILFNFYPAKIFAGSSGSFFMGYLVSILAIFAGAKIGTALLVLIVPLTDAFFVIWQRWKDKQSFFQADTRHLHHSLLQIGWSSRKISLFYYFITIIGSVVALFTSSINKLVIFLIFFLIILTFCFILSRKIKKLKS